MADGRGSPGGVSLLRRARWLDEVAAYIERGELPHSALTIGQRIAFVYLNGKSGKAWPTQQTLAARCNLKERQVRVLMSALERLGLIVVRPQGRRRPNEVRLGFPTHDRQLNAGHQSGGASEMAPPWNAASAVTGSPAHGDRHSGAAVTGSGVPPEPSEGNPVKEPSESDSFVRSAMNGRSDERSPDELTSKIWEAVEGAGKRRTSRSRISRALAACEAAGDDAHAVVGGTVACLAFQSATHSEDFGQKAAHEIIASGRWRSFLDHQVDTPDAAAFD